MRTPAVPAVMSNANSLKLLAKKSSSDKRGMFSVRSKKHASGDDVKQQSISGSGGSGQTVNANKDGSELNALSALNEHNQR